MRIIDSCVECLYEKQESRVKEVEAPLREAFLKEVRNALDTRRPEDSAPYMIYVFNEIYRKYFGKTESYGKEKKKYNDLVLSMEAQLEREIEATKDPLATSLMYARIGNYIDFGALKEVDEAQFLALFNRVEMREEEENIYQSFVKQCACGNTFLLLADNCGEIVLDKLFLRQLKKRFPQLKLQVMVRGGEALNDVTLEDAQYVGLQQEAEIISSGNDVAGTIVEMLSKEARTAFEEADVILSKGQGNYESLTGQKKRMFYSFLCKCDLFIDRFEVPALTGMFIEE